MRAFLFIIFIFICLPIVLADYHPCQEVIPGYQYTPKGGTLPHYEAFKIDPVSEERVAFGYCFFPHEVLKEDNLNPLEMVVGLDIQENIVNFRIEKASVYKPYLLFDTDWPNQVIGKNIRDPWEYSKDITEFFPKHDATVNLAKQFLYDVQESSKRIANLYLSDEVKESARQYIIHTQQVQQLRDARSKIIIREQQQKPSQDYVVQLAIDEKIALLKDPVKITDSHVLPTPALYTSISFSRIHIFWVFVILIVLVIILVVYGLFKSF